MGRLHISYDRHGTPGIWSEDIVGAYFALGYIHGYHRPIQTLIISAAARGELSGSFVPRQELFGIDLVSHRLDLVENGRQAVSNLSHRGRELLEAYVGGLHQGLENPRAPPLGRWISKRLRRPDPASVISGTLLAAYLGLAQCQERMERALVDAVQAGANPRLLETMFSPHLRGWDPSALLGIQPAPPRARVLSAGTLGGGSNAWAVHGSRTARGTPLLCGDPHLGIDQLPAIFLEVRAHVGDNYWLGATIPGLPGVGIGRNRHVAWAGTFAVADNVDFTIEDAHHESVKRGGDVERLSVREVEIRRRFKGPVRVSFVSSDRGTLERPEGKTLASRWAGCARASEAIEAYMVAPDARSVNELSRILDHAHPFSLHFVLAERGGSMVYRQGGRIPKRSGSWSGLYPVAPEQATWTGFFEGANLLEEGPGDGVVVSANEARQAPDGTWYATLAQPNYRLERIRAQLLARTDHDIGSMQAIQLDLFSHQPNALLPTLKPWLPNNALTEQLDRWDHRYDIQSHGAGVFEYIRQCAIDVLADDLGGEWLRSMLADSELPIWWMHGFDRLLANATIWDNGRGEKLHRAMRQHPKTEFPRWGEQRRVQLDHLILGGLPRMFGLNRGPFELAGSSATPCQGHVTRVDGQPSVVAPAYRFITDLADDWAYSALPGGIDGSYRSNTYDHWLDDYWRGAYHRIAPPEPDEPKHPLVYR